MVSGFGNHIEVLKDVQGRLFVPIYTYLRSDASSFSVFLQSHPLHHIWLEQAIHDITTFLVSSTWHPPKDWFGLIIAFRDHTPTGH